MNLPQDLHYTKDHEWVRKEGGIFTVGVTDFAQQQLTDVVFVELPEVGKKFDAHKTAAVIESVKSVSDVFAPFAGEIVEVNNELLDSPQLINSDPYGKGWLFKMKSDGNESSLLSADEYQKSAGGH